MNEVEALRFAANFLKSKRFYVYKTGVTWMALNTIDGAARALRAEANERESVIPAASISPRHEDRWWDSDNAKWVYPDEDRPMA